jgi:hypothetical protein
MNNRIRRFTVRGKGYFPGVMLQRDFCRPATTDDEELITRSSITFVEIEMLAIAGFCTPEEWQKFGWTVIRTKDE